MILAKPRRGPKAEKQQALLDALFGRGDVPIPDLYAAVRSDEVDNMQAMQRWLGPYITNLNRNLTDQGLRVEPGQTKNTYRLVSTT